MIHRFHSVSPKIALMNYLFAFAVIVASLVPTATVVATEAKDGTTFSLLVVGDKVPDLNSLTWSAVVNGQMKPLTDVKNDRLRLVIRCDIAGEDLPLELPDFVQKLPNSTPQEVQVCILFSASQQQVSDVLAKRIPLDTKTYGDLFANALLITVENRQLLEKAGLLTNGKFPGMEGWTLNDGSDLASSPLALLFGKSGLIEWAGDLTWVDRPISQLIAGTWDRSVTELASRLSQAMFFEMRFYLEAADNILKRKGMSGVDSLGQYKIVDGFRIRQASKSIVNGFDPLSKINVAKPLQLCIEAEAKAERTLALNNLVESLLAVTPRVISCDQYWVVRPVSSLRQSLEKTVSISQEVALLVDDTIKKKLEVQQQSLGQVIKLLKAVEAGGFLQVKSLIEGFPEQEQQDNQFGFVRCQIDACLISGSTEAAALLNNLLTQFTEPTIETLDFHRFKEYCQSVIIRRLLAGEFCSDEMKAIARARFSSSDRFFQEIMSGKPDVITIRNP